NDMTELMQRNRLDIERTGDSADRPGVLGVVEMHRLWQGSSHHGAARWEVCMGQDATDHAEIRISVGTPPDVDVSRLPRRHLGKGQWHGALPCSHCVTH